MMPQEPGKINPLSKNVRETCITQVNKNGAFRKCRLLTLVLRLHYYQILHGEP